MSVVIRKNSRKADQHVNRLADTLVGRATSAARGLHLARRRDHFARAGKSQFVRQPTDSMRAFISTVVGLFVASIVGELVGASLFTAFRRLYRPPHGRAMLGATWLFAIAGFIGAATHRTSPSLLQLSFLVGIPGLAFIAVLVTRDEYREARGQAFYQSSCARQRVGFHSCCAPRARRRGAADNSWFGVRGRCSSSRNTAGGHECAVSLRRYSQASHPCRRNRNR